MTLIIDQPTTSNKIQGKDFVILKALLSSYNALNHYRDNEEDSVLEFDYLIEDDLNNAIQISGEFQFSVSSFQCPGDRDTPSYSETEVTLSGIVLGECTLCIGDDMMIVDNSQVESILLNN